MKNLTSSVILSISLLVGLTFTGPVNANGNFMVLATSLCEYTKANNHNEIRKQIRKSGYKLRKIYDDIKCNGQTLHEFAKANSSEDVVAFYEKKIKKLRT